MAPPKKSVDLAEVRRLADLGMTNRQIAAAMDVGVVTLWKKGWRRDEQPEQTDWESVQAKLDAGAYFKDVAAELGLSPKGMRSRRSRAGLPPLVVQPRLGERAPAYKRGRYTTRRGYVRILMPEHPHAGRGGYVLEHRLVMEAHLGRCLFSEEVVHHINDVKDDNRLENLELFPNNATHISATRKGVRRVQ